MEQYTSSLMALDRRLRQPAVVWVMSAGIVATLLAAFLFKVAVGTIETYGFFGLMVLSHLFTHRGHGSHGAHNSQSSSESVDETKADQKNNHISHGSCH